MSVVYTHATLDRPGPMASDVRVRGNTEKVSAGEFGFSDFLDVINPLQHIPIVSSIYRELTGDELGAPARILGGALFAGPLGAAAGAASAAVEAVSGKDPGAHAVAFLGLGSGSEDASATAIAAVEQDESVPVEEQQVALLEPIPTEAVVAEVLPIPAFNPQLDSAVLSSMASMEEDVAVAETPASIAPLGMASVDAAASFPGNRMPKELLEALYDMHRSRFLHAAAELGADHSL
jgi:hypothetical protein